MTTITHTCDRCGATVKDKGNLIEITTPEISAFVRETKVELCAGCVGQIACFIKTPPKIEMVTSVGVMATVARRE